MKKRALFIILALTLVLSFITLLAAFAEDSTNTFNGTAITLSDWTNAGVARIITFADKDKGDGSLGSYDNPYDGTADFSATTEWMHVKFTLTMNDAKEYQYGFSTRKRIYNWVDLNVTIWV